MNISNHLGLILTLTIAAIHIVGVFSAFDALWLVRSSQGAIAWGMSMIIFPYAAVPLYWMFGRRRFKGYREVLKQFAQCNRSMVRDFEDLIRQNRVSWGEGEKRFQILEQLAGAPFVEGNSAEILIDGEQTFNSIFSEIDKAERFILIQYYIVRDDVVGTEMKNRLVARARAGVSVFMLYDEVGSSEVKDLYISELKDAGVKVLPFATRRGRGNFFQVNFRNHRKIVVVDGQVAFVGGLNIGDEYLGRDPQYGYWRDTQLKISGPVTLQVQRLFSSDWLWAADALPGIEWFPARVTGECKALMLPSGPADERDRCSLQFLELINSAKSRFWISTPYFVPDDAIISALQLAGLRGVDVRILLPAKADHLLVWWASFLYVAEVAPFKVRVFRYQKGFLHQKALVVDDDLVSIGTVNLDNRSFRLNFEVMIAIYDRIFASKAIAMFESDFKDSLEEVLYDTEDLPLWQRLGARFARLFAPIL